jgi:probable rRNA maturation factor
MTVIFSNRQDQLALPPGIEDAIKQISSLALKDYGLPDAAEISVVFCDNNIIQELNRQWREIDAVTDVLSFPLLDDLNALREMPADEMLLGDIIICMERAALQAEDYGHSLRRELLYLFTHGLLHLLGLDHRDERESSEMRQREEELLAKVGAPR